MMQQLLVNTPNDSEWVPGNDTLYFPAGLKVLVAGNFRWENRLVASAVAHYFPRATTTQLTESALMDIMPFTIADYDLVILDEMLLCGNHRAEICGALESGATAAKVVVYGNRFFNDPAGCPAVIDLQLSKALPMEEIACRLCMVLQ